jgi:hypothetical protein
MIKTNGFFYSIKIKGNVMGKVLSTQQKEWRRKWVVLFSALESLVESGIKL